MLTTDLDFLSFWQYWGQCLGEYSGSSVLALREDRWSSIWEILFLALLYLIYAESAVLRRISGMGSIYDEIFRAGGGRGRGGGGSNVDIQKFRGWESSTTNNLELGGRSNVDTQKCRRFPLSPSIIAVIP